MTRERGGRTLASRGGEIDILDGMLTGVWHHGVDKLDGMLQRKLRWLNSRRYTLDGIF